MSSTSSSTFSSSTPSPTSPSHTPQTPPLTTKTSNKGKNKINYVSVIPPGNWQGDLMVKLLVRDRREKSFTEFVESCKLYE